MSLYTPRRFKGAKVPRVLFSVPADLLNQVDRAIDSPDHPARRNRTEFVRLAIAEKLQRSDITSPMTRTPLPGLNQLGSTYAMDLLAAVGHAEEAGLLDPVRARQLKSKLLRCVGCQVEFTLHLDARLSVDGAFLKPRNRGTFLLWWLLAGRQTGKPELEVAHLWPGSAPAASCRQAFDRAAAELRPFSDVLAKTAEGVHVRGGCVFLPAKGRHSVHVSLASGDVKVA